METRERILAAASDLFSRHGYFGTSTRDIAKVVGIRQPSMYAHFSSKAAVMHELLELNIGVATRAARSAQGFDASPGARLYRLICCDVAYLRKVPYDLGGSLTRGVLEDPDFSNWTTTYDELHAIRRRMIIEGIEAGQFRRVEPKLAEHHIAAMLSSLVLAGPGIDRTSDASAQGIADLLTASMVDRFDQVRAIADEARRLPDPYESHQETPHR